MATRDQILDITVCISHSANTREKDMNPFTLLPVMDKYKDWLSSQIFLWQPVLEKENSEFNHVELRLKIELVSHPADVKGCPVS